MPQVFVKDPPAALGGQVDFDAVFEAAGIDDEQAGRVARAQELLASLPGETPAPVRKQIVEASLKAFGVPIDKIIEAGSPRSRRSRATSGPAPPTRRQLLAESAARIKKFEDEIQRIRTVMDQRVQEQQAVTKACNERKLGVQQVLEFFGQEAVARVVQARLDAPSRGARARPDLFLARRGDEHGRRMGSSRGSATSGGGSCRSGSPTSRRSTRRSPTRTPSTRWSRSTRS